MKFNLLTIAFCILTITANAQKTDSWGNVPQAQDDRFTNPKKPLYAGPNGWWNFGEIRITDAPNYSFKGGFNEISVGYALADSRKLLTLYLSFEEETPVVGNYTVAKEGNVAARKIHVSFSDVSNQKIKEWSAISGTVEITKQHGFLYFKARNLTCEASGLHNKNDKAIILGFEGAVKHNE